MPRVVMLPSTVAVLAVAPLIWIENSLPVTRLVPTMQTGAVSVTAILPFRRASTRLSLNRHCAASTWTAGASPREISTLPRIEPWAPGGWFSATAKARAERYGRPAPSTTVLAGSTRTVVTRSTR